MGLVLDIAVWTILAFVLAVAIASLVLGIAMVGNSLWRRARGLGPRPKDPEQS